MKCNFKKSTLNEKELLLCIDINAGHTQFAIDKEEFKKSYRNCRKQIREREEDECVIIKIDEEEEKIEQGKLTLKEIKEHAENFIMKFSKESIPKSSRDLFNNKFDEFYNMVDKERLESKKYDENE